MTLHLIVRILTSAHLTDLYPHLVAIGANGEEKVIVKEVTMVVMIAASTDMVGMVAAVAVVIVIMVVTAIAAVVGERKIRTYPCICLLYTSPSPRDVEESRMPSSA